MRRMENAKTTRWAFTAFESQWPLFTSIPSIVAEWGWQTEKAPDTGNLHYQGYIRTSRQVRMSQLRKALPGVHLELARNWSALQNYCKKSETAVPGTQVNMVNPARAMTMAQALIRIASHKFEIEHEKGTDKYNDAVKLEYWYAVNEILRDDPDAVGVFTQPQYERAWIKTRETWIEKFEEEMSNLENQSQTDRQTDNGGLASGADGSA